MIFLEHLLNAEGCPEWVDPDGTSDPKNGQYSKFTYVQSRARINGGEFNLDIHHVKWLRLYYCRL